MSKSRNTPLLWATPPRSLMRQIYNEARKSAPFSGSGGSAVSDSILAKQAYLRKVGAAYAKALVEAGLYVEGLS